MHVDRSVHMEFGVRNVCPFIIKKLNDLPNEENTFSLLFHPVIFGHLPREVVLDGDLFLLQIRLVNVL